MICLTLESTNAHFLVIRCKEVNVIIIIYHVMHVMTFLEEYVIKYHIKSHSLYNTIYGFKYLNSYEHYNYKWSCLYWGYNQIWFYDILRFRYVCKKGYTMEVKTFTLYNENNAFYNLIPYQMSAINWSYYRVSTLLIITLGRLYFSEEKNSRKQ